MATYTTCTSCNQTLSNCNCGCESTCAPSSISSTCLVHDNEQGNVIFNDILPKIRREYDLTCLGGVTGTNPFDTIQSILTTVCATVVPVYDLSCLGGAAADTQQVAISTLITKVCNIAGVSTHNIECLGLGLSATAPISTAVDELISKVCSTTIIGTLDWTCLNDPSSVNLTVVLQAILDQSKANKLTVTPSTHLLLNTNDPCNPVLSLDEIQLTSTIQNNIAYSVGPGDLCKKDYLIEAFSVGEGLALSKKCSDLYTYSFSPIVLPTEWLFNSITLPYGVTYTMTGGPSNDVILVRAFLLSIGLPMANVNISGGNQLTVTFQAYGSASNTPTINITSTTAGGPKDITTSYASIVPNADTCCTIHIETKEEPVTDCKKIGAGTGIEVTNVDLVKVAYNFSHSTIGTLNAYTHFDGNQIVLPSSIALTNTPLLQSTFDGFGFSGKFTITNPFVGYVFIKYEEYLVAPYGTIPEFLISGVVDYYDTTSVDVADTCNQDVISLSNSGGNWNNVTYYNNWTGNIQYRVVGTDRVEVKGGFMRKVLDASVNASLLTSDALSEIGFGIPGTSSGIVYNECGGTWFDHNNYANTGASSSNWNTIMDYNPHRASITKGTTLGNFIVNFSRQLIVDRPAISSAITANDLVQSVNDNKSIEVITSSFQYYI